MGGVQKEKTEISLKNIDKIESDNLKTSVYDNPFDYNLLVNNPKLLQLSYNLSKLKTT